jgi:hypothetical protein
MGSQIQAAPNLLLVFLFLILILFFRVSHRTSLTFLFSEARLGRSPVAAVTLEPQWDDNERVNA